VFVDGGGRNPQLLGNLPIGAALADLTQNLRLAGAEELSLVVEVLGRAAPAGRPNAASRMPRAMSPRSATTVGKAVATMVWSSAASSMPSSTATKMKLRRCGLTSALLGSGSAAVAAGAAGLVMPAFRCRPML